MADWDVYLDDSSVSKPNRYMMLGGVMLKTEHALRLRHSIGCWRKREGLHHEIAWRKTDRENVIRYMTFAKGAMHYINCGQMVYSCARFDREDNQLFPDTDREAARDKLVYQLLLHSFGLRSGSGDRVFIYPDQDLIKGSVEELRRILNCGIAQATGWRGVDSIRAIHPRRSHDCHFVQMSDLLTGCIACASNNSHDAESRRGAAKQKLRDYVEELAGVPFNQPTQCNRGKFNIWFFEPRIKMASAIPTTSAKPRVQTGHATP